LFKNTFQQIQRFTVDIPQFLPFTDFQTHLGLNSWTIICPLTTQPDCKVLFLLWEWQLCGNVMHSQILYEGVDGVYREL
jgi:hypothetical protein